MRASWFIGILALIAVVSGVWWYVTETPPAVPNAGEEDRGAQTYTNSTYGLSFEYPDSYALEEREVGNAQRAHYSIVVADREALEDAPQNGEGPPAITIDVFQNNLDQEELKNWVRGNSNSNFKLSPDDTLTETTLASARALTYAWDGLYRGRTIVAAHRDNVVMVSVQFLTPEDEIIDDFEVLADSLVFY